MIVLYMVFKFDPSQPGLRKTLREYQELALRFVWEVVRGVLTQVRARRLR